MPYKDVSIMAKLLVVEASVIVRGVFKELLEKHTDFQYDLVATYSEAKELLEKGTYVYAVVERNLEDAPKGEIIALFNKHNIAPLVFTKEIDEVFFESFEGAQIVDYILKQKYNNITHVIQRLKQLRANKKITVLVVSDSSTYGSYLKQNLNIHKFNVLSATNNQEAYEKLEMNSDISLMVVDNIEPNINALELIENIRQRRNKESLKVMVLADKPNSYFTSSLLNAGADDYIIKPFSRDEFYVRVYQNIQTIPLD